MITKIEAIKELEYLKRYLGTVNDLDDIYEINEALDTAIYYLTKDKPEVVCIDKKSCDNCARARALTPYPIMDCIYYEVCNWYNKPFWKWNGEPND